MDSHSRYGINSRDSSEGVFDSSSDRAENKFNNLEGENKTSAEHVDGLVEGGKSISRSNSSDSVVILKGKIKKSDEDVEFTGAALKDGEKILFTQRGSPGGEPSVLNEAPKEAVAEPSSKPPPPSIEKKEEKKGALMNLIGKVKERVEKTKTTKAEDAKAAVQEYFREFKDDMFKKEPSAFRAYLTLLGFDIQTYENPGQDFTGFKEYITGLILDENIKKRDLSPNKLNRVLTELINKKIDDQKAEISESKVKLTTRSFKSHPFEGKK